jgi:hypothetical protein
LIAEYISVLTQAKSLTLTLPTDKQNFALSANLERLKRAPGLDILALIDYLLIPKLKGGSTLSAFATLNLISPTANRLTHSGSDWTYEDEGGKWNGSSSFGITNFNPATHGVNYTLDSAMRMILVTGAPTVGTAMDGNAAGNQNKSQYSNTSQQRINSGTGDLTPPHDFATGVGWKTLARLSATKIQIDNGTSYAEGTQNSSAIASANQTLGRFGTGGAASYSDIRIGAYILAAFLRYDIRRYIYKSFDIMFKDLGF